METLAHGLLSGFMTEMSESTALRTENHGQSCVGLARSSAFSLNDERIHQYRLAEFVVFFLFC